MRHSAHGKSMMTPLLVVTIAVGLVAVGVHQLREKGRGKTFTPRSLFEDLDRSAIAKVSVAGPFESFSIVKSEDGWGLVERGGYKIDAERFARLINAVILLEPVDRMTQNANNYARLGVEATAPSSARLGLFDAGGEEIAGLYVGNELEGRPASPGGFAPPVGQAVRKEGDPWVYKIAEPLSVDATPSGWLATSVMTETPDDFYRIQIDHRATTESLLLTRSGTENYRVVTSMPAGKRPTDWKVSSVGRALSSITLTDVMTRDGEEFARIDFASTYTAVKKNGFSYVVRAGKSEADSVVTIDAAYDAAFDLRNSDIRTSDSVMAATMEDPQTTVADARMRHSRWAYKISNFKYDDLAKKLSDLIEDDPEAQAAAEAGPPPPVAEAPPTIAVTPPPADPPVGEPPVPTPPPPDPTATPIPVTRR